MTVARPLHERRPYPTTPRPQSRLVRWLWWLAIGTVAVLLVIFGLRHIPTQDQLLTGRGIEWTADSGGFPVTGMTYYGSYDDPFDVQLPVGLPGFPECDGTLRSHSQLGVVLDISRDGVPVVTLTSPWVSELDEWPIVVRSCRPGAAASG
ncbi:hypothetical protein JNJ66_04510 [Candidatus Saccharibacteria bacterium]|nr:hypothetical protein [Candidatus Saccharibacteria bacterium]